MSSRQRHARAREVLKQVGLADRMDHHPGQLSGGQQQRVAIARAIVNRPAILMADEPTGNLDSRTSKDVMGLFRELNEKNGITIIVVTHDPSVARSARRIVVLSDGKVVEDTSDISRAIQALHFTNGEEEKEGREERGEGRLETA
jgi:ABC-type lipoprotein export system ATPase subunit